MMKKIQEKYSQKKLDYVNLDPLSFKVVKGFSSSNKLALRNNLSSFINNKLNAETIILDLKELCLLTRIHMYDSKLIRLDLEIALDINGPFVKVEKNLDIISGKIRVIKVGSLPCRYFKIRVTRGSPLTDFNKIECFGLHINDIKNKFDEDTLDILFYNAYDLIYSKLSENK